MVIIANDLIGAHTPNMNNVVNDLVTKYGICCINGPEGVTITNHGNGSNTHR